MPRDIVLGNQSFLVNIDKWLQIRDIFYPHVGQENHVQGHAHKIGIFTEGSFSWINEEGWDRDIGYEEGTLVSQAYACNDSLGVELEFNDCVSCDHDIFLRKVTLKNDSDRERKIKVFFYQDFHLYGTDIGDTAGYDAENNSVFHYKRNRYFMINAIREETCTSCQPRGDISDYAVGQSEQEGAVGTWKDAEDGDLSQNPIAQGSVDSTVAVEAELGAGEEQVFYYWIAAGDCREDIKELNSFMMEEHPENIFETTRKCWRGVVDSNPRDFKDLGEDVKHLYQRSILTVISHIDESGAIIAANDSENMKFNRDTYSYCWPRDGALVALAFDRAGFHEYTKPFFRFCAEVISGRGSMLHKYNPDGSLGSTWHPWVKNGEPHLPIQEDETALVIYALRKHFEQTGDENLVEELYDSLILPAAEFMCRHTRDDNLPIECYDLWEEREGIMTYTVSTVIAGLWAAGKFAEEFGDEEKAEEFYKTGDAMKESLLEYLWDEEEERFLRRIRCLKDHDEEDAIPEASTFAVFEFDVLPADDERVVRNMEGLKEDLWLDTEVGGMARYTEDSYHSVSRDVPGNPWFITTIWYGKWLIQRADSLDDLEEAKEVIDWVVDNATESNMLPEQLHPYTGEPLSVSPLTWSHSSFVDIVNDYIDKFEDIKN